MEPQVKTVTLTLEGMGCGGCAARIEGMLGQSEGVRSAAVSFERREAVVQFDPSRTAAGSRARLLAARGYRAVPAE